jgi:hypothetical protein
MASAPAPWPQRADFQRAVLELLRAKNEYVNIANITLPPQLKPPPGVGRSEKWGDPSDLLVDSACVAQRIDARISGGCLTLE